MRNTYNDFQKANQRLELLIRVGQRLSVAEDEEMLTDMFLDLPHEVLPVVGCSFTAPADKVSEWEMACFEDDGTHLLRVNPTY